MFDELKKINFRPAPFEFYTAEALWNDPHTSKQMLKYHLNEAIDVSSRNRSFIKTSVEWIESYFHVDEHTKIADFGCGPGLYTTRLAQKGAIVTGIDFSENSILYAEQSAAEKSLDIQYTRMNYLEFDTAERFDLITMIMCDYCALSPDQRKVMLSKFRSLLKPKGALLIDVYSLESYKQKEEAATYQLNQLDGFWSQDDYYCFVNTFKYEKEKVILDKYTIFEKNRKRIVYNWLQYFSPATLEAEIEKNGFKVEAVYANVAGEPLTQDATELAAVALK